MLTKRDTTAKLTVMMMLLTVVSAYVIQPTANRGPKVQSNSRFAHIKLTWEEQVAERILERFHEHSSVSDEPLMVAIVGIPGSGKSTSVEVLADILNQVISDDACLCMPFDGYHIPRAQLLTFPKAEDAIWRRGAPDTFDAKLLCRDLHRIRNGCEERVLIPGFCHADGDPICDTHEFQRQNHKIVLCEGLYLLHDQHGFEHVKDYFHTSLFLDANLETCMSRLKVRNKVIPGYGPEEIEYRVDAVDRINALIVQQSKVRAEIVVPVATW
ncbi:putative kinase [Mayamaea pseudoterrestris]|nr:putative kinase [Mayamaea pseudoterrestris]